MTTRKKILIIEHDDFLREIIGNLLHKQGGYILNGSTITKGILRAENHHIDSVILGTSCDEYKGKETVQFIKKELGQSTAVDFFIINTTGKELDFIDKEKQILKENLSIQKILHALAL